MKNKLSTQLQQYVQSKQDRTLDLSQFTHARIGLGHTGGLLKLKNWLEFQAGFAQAKDAVFSHFNVAEIKSICNHLKISSLELHTQIENPTQFLLRPDLGRLLNNESEKHLSQFIEDHPQTCGKDLLIVISGGLSPIAIQHQMPRFLPYFIQQVRHEQWSLAPIIINQRGRVAFGDEINSYIKAKIVIMLIGERPGLSTPDSLGIYFTFNAKPGCTDEQRNCISNIHPQGLSIEEAAKKLVNLLQKAFLMRCTGVLLKDD